MTPSRAPSAPPVGARPRRFARFAADQRGATAIEYGLMTALIGIAILATVFSMGAGYQEPRSTAQITNALAPTRCP